MNGFKEYHPMVTFIYFAFTITFSMLFMHPACLAFSFVGAFLYSALLNRAKVVLYTLPISVLAAVLNPVFNHGGATIIFYFGNGNPFTAESVYYGLAAAMVISTAICWFSCFNAIIGQEKIIYLFGKIIPSMSLILSMTMRLVSEFKQKTRDIFNAERGLGIKKNRFKEAASVFGALMNILLEEAVETADSMACRGYGLKKRTSYSNYIFTGRDAALLIVVVASGIYITVGSFFGAMKYRYFPTLSGAEITPYTVSVLAVYFVMCMMPSIVEFTEVCRWKSLKSKI